MERNTFDIPDSTDWLNTPLSAFSSFENALHCQICKEFYDTPMITSCAHTFCSKCIRTSLSTDGKCPACRAPDQASKLRNNWVLQEVVGSFLEARPKALEVARRAKELEDEEMDGGKGRGLSRGKRKRIVLDSDDVNGSDGLPTRRKSARIAASQTSEPESVVEIRDSDDDDDFIPEETKEQIPDDGLVECPLGCGKRMKIEAVEPHLDRCEDEKKQASSRSQSRTPVNIFGSAKPRASSTQTQSAKPQERISELSYSLLNETKLGRKLKDLGLPSWGAKSLLIKRHTEWVNLWNANCDSSHPRTKRELLQDLDSWERTQGGLARGGAVGGAVMKKDFDGKGWQDRNRDDFSRLIAEAKRKKGNPALDEERPKGVDEEVPLVDVAVNGDEIKIQSTAPPEIQHQSPSAVDEPPASSQPLPQLPDNSPHPNSTSSETNLPPPPSQPPTAAVEGFDSPALLEQSHLVTRQQIMLTERRAAR